MINISKKTVLSLFASIALSTVAMAQQDKVYATVNSMEITASDIAMVIKDPRVQFDSLPKQTKDQILGQLIDKKLLANKAMHSDVTKSDLYKDTLEKTIKSVKQDLALQIWIQTLSKDVKVSQKDMKKYYETNKAKFIRQEELKASHILVKTEKEAKDIIKKLQKSKNLKVDFTKLAKEKSTGPSGKTGGELGWFTKDKMVPEFSTASANLEIGTITSTPVKTQFGYHIIYLDDKKTGGTISFNEAQNNIRQILGQTNFKNKIDTILKDLKAKAKIQYK